MIDCFWNVTRIISLAWNKFFECVHITEIIIEIYDNSNSLVKSSTFNDVNGYNNLVNIDFSIPNINLDCIVHSYSYKIYFRRDCDIFPLFGFSASGGIQCY